MILLVIEMIPRSMEIRNNKGIMAVLQGNFPDYACFVASMETVWGIKKKWCYKLIVYVLISWIIFGLFNITRKLEILCSKYNHNYSLVH